MQDRLSKNLQHNIDISSNQSKSVMLSDEWETYTLKFSVYQPLEGQCDMILEGNKAELERVVMA